jgi:hypothetical protein
MSHKPLSVHDTVLLCEIVHAAQGCNKIARLIDGYVIYGTARAVSDVNGNFLPPTVDIRDGYLRVTTQGGMEAFWPVSELMAQVATAEFCRYDW